MLVSSMQADDSARTEQIVIVQQSVQEVSEDGAPATASAAAVPEEPSVGISPAEAALQIAMDTSSHSADTTALADSQISGPISVPAAIDTTAAAAAAAALIAPTKPIESRNRFVQVGDIVILEVNGDKYTFLPVKQSGYDAPKSS